MQRLEIKCELKVFIISKNVKANMKLSENFDIYSSYVLATRATVSFLEENPEILKVL